MRWETDWNPEIALRFRFAAVFQGGGIRGLFFPGHIVGLVQRGIGKIFVYAGASAGALIALGFWAGLPPHELKKFLSKRCGYFGLVRSMFSPWDLLMILLTWGLVGGLALLKLVWRLLIFLFLPAALFFAIFFLPMNLFVKIGLCVVALAVLLWLLPRLLRLMKLIRLESYPGCAGKRFERLINEMILEGLERRGIHQKLIDDLIEPPGEFWPTFRDIWRLSLWVRLVNGVTGTGHPDYATVEAVYPALQAKRKELQFTPSDRHSPNNIWQLVYGMPAPSEPFFAPIFISTCCVDDRLPVLFNNIEERYWDVPIAHIVRASAGHPVVFRPKSLRLPVPGTPNAQPQYADKRYTDGGLMANFPAFAVNHALRQLFNRTNDDLPEDYKTIRTLPYGTIGLAVADESSPGTYLAVLRDVLMGGARERLEYELASTSPYFRLVRQTAQGEPHFLNFFSVKPKLIEATFEKAARHFDTVKISSTVDLEPLKEELLDNLKGAMHACNKIFPITDGGYTRGHLFFEADTREGLFNKKAMICRGRPIAGFQDTKLSVPKEFAGLVGLVRTSSCPLFCRIDVLQARRKANPNQAILGLTMKETDHLPTDLNFCFVIPIFDYRNINYETGDILDRPVPGCEDCIRLIDTGIEGPLIGALSIDGRSDAAAAELGDLVKRILDNSILSTLERYAWEMGCLVAKQVAITIDGIDT